VHAFWALGGMAVGAIAGYLGGIVLYVLLLASSVFVTSNSAASNAVVRAAENSAVFPLIFALLLALLGFMAGYYESLKNEAKPAA